MNTDEILQNTKRIFDKYGNFYYNFKELYDKLNYKSCMQDLEFNGDLIHIGQDGTTSITKSILDNPTTCFKNEEYAKLFVECVLNKYEYHQIKLEAIKVRTNANSGRGTAINTITGEISDDTLVDSTTPSLMLLNSASLESIALMLAKIPQS